MLRNNCQCNIATSFSYLLFTFENVWLLKNLEIDDTVLRVVITLKILSSTVNYYRSRLTSSVVITSSQTLETYDLNLNNCDEVAIKYN